MRCRSSRSAATPPPWPTRRPTDRGRAALAALAVLAVARPAMAAVDLRVVNTAHYAIHTDEPDGALVDGLGRQMDAVYGAYADQLAGFRPPADAPPLAVYLFAKRDRFAAFARVAGPNSGGIFVPGPRPFLASYVDGQDHDELRQTLRHEGFHQFAYFNVSRRLPVWLNEGLAQLFEDGIWTGRGLLLGQVTPRRVRQLRSDRDRNTTVPLARLVALTPAVWDGTLRRDVNAGETNYNGAWALAQYLTFGPKPDARDRTAGLLRRLHEMDRAGHADDAAIAAAVHDCFPDLPTLQREFTAWSVALRPTDEAALLERQSTLGDFLVDYRNAGRTFPDVAALRATAERQHLRVTYVRGLVRRQTEADVGVYFADLAGGPYTPRQLYLDPAGDAPLPDLVCQATAGFRVRTHFYRDDRGTLGHEVSVEPTEGP